MKERTLSSLKSNGDTIQAETLAAWLRAPAAERARGDGNTEDFIAPIKSLAAMAAAGAIVRHTEEFRDFA